MSRDLTNAVIVCNIWKNW